MNKKFYSDATLLDIVLLGLLEDFDADDIVVATSCGTIDDIIVETGNKNKVLTFRGDENNVLLRFIEAAAAFNLTYVIRICADNPFIINSFIRPLVLESIKANLDYISYKTSEGLPSIRTHYGFFAEIVSVAALKYIITNSNDQQDLEHVTRHIYNHQEEYKIEWLPIPKAIEKADLRLTIDTAEDFFICQNIYQHLKITAKEINPENIIQFLDTRSDLRQIIKNQIRRNQK